MSAEKDQGGGEEEKIIERKSRPSRERREKGRRRFCLSILRESITLRRFSSRGEKEKSTKGPHLFSTTGGRKKKRGGEALPLLLQPREKKERAAGDDGTAPEVAGRGERKEEERKRGRYRVVVWVPPKEWEKGRKGGRCSPHPFQNQLPTFKEESRGEEEKVTSAQRKGERRKTFLFSAEQLDRGGQRVLCDEREEKGEEESKHNYLDGRKGKAGGFFNSGKEAWRRVPRDKKKGESDAISTEGGGKGEKSLHTLSSSPISFRERTFCACPTGLVEKRRRKKSHSPVFADKERGEDFLRGYP